MQHGVFKISNNEEKIINPSNPLSLQFTPPSNRGVDHKDRRLARLITFLKYAILHFTQNNPQSCLYQSSQEN